MFLTVLLAAAAPVAPVSTAAVPSTSEAPVRQTVQSSTPTGEGERLPVPARPLGTSAPIPATSARPDIGYMSAGGLRDRCESTAAGLVSYCFAYITGVHDSVRAYETWLRFREFCPRVLSSQADLRRAFLTYVKSNPDAAVGEAASVVVLALKDQFPCQAPEKEKPAPKADPKRKS